jgi:hypothetical protein
MNTEDREQIQIREQRQERVRDREREQNQETEKQKPKTKIKIAKSGEMIEQAQFRVVMNADANAGLDEYVEILNTGFQGGKVTKSDIANYVFARLKGLLSDNDQKVIQNSCFDDKEALRSLAKGENELPESVKKAIREAYGLTEVQKKRPTKNFQEAIADKGQDHGAIAKPVES